jgi:hypothetical protein
VLGYRYKDEAPRFNGKLKTIAGGNPELGENRFRDDDA